MFTASPTVYTVHILPSMDRQNQCGSFTMCSYEKHSTLFKILSTSRGVTLIRYEYVCKRFLLEKTGLPEQPMWSPDPWSQVVLNVD